MTAAVVVVGSLNMDMVMHVARAPRAGETLTGRRFFLNPGGKGANQAVAAARLGAGVAMVGRVGDDAFGARMVQALRADGIETSGVGVCAGTSTGVAMIMVDDAGENRIALAPGANLMLSAEDVAAAAAAIAQARMVVAQLEVPVPAMLRAITLARESGAQVLLNPAPAVALPDDIWRGIDYLVPNETEATLLGDVEVRDAESAAAAARAFRARGVRHVLITLGEKGVLVAGEDGEWLVPARAVAAVDTTAAGDCFVGGVVAGLTEGMTLAQAARLGVAAASVCVTRRGAQESLPYRREIAEAVA